MAAWQRQQQLRRRSVDPRALLAGTQLLQRVLAMQRKPPVTLALLAANAACWAAPQILGPGRPALCPSRLMAGFDPPYWSMLFHLVHADDGGWHLYYNMAALLAKGLVLEQSLGSEQFAAMLVLLAMGTSLAYITLAYVLTVLIGVAPTYYGCVVGFSGVLFPRVCASTHSAGAPPRRGSNEGRGAIRGTGITGVARQRTWLYSDVPADLEAFPGPGS